MSLSNIQLLILDVDGVLTDGGIIRDDAGQQIKRFHVRDGNPSPPDPIRTPGPNKIPH